jgi:hypothetical protein
MLYNAEKEKLVLDLYYNQHKSIREIAKIARMSFRDIGAIIKKGPNGNSGGGNGMVVDNQQRQESNHNNNQSPNEKFIQAYKFFLEGKKLSEVAIELGLREKEASKYFNEFLRLKGLQEIYEMYIENKYYLKSFRKLFRLLKREGMTAENMQWFVNMVKIGTYKIPQLQNQYERIKDELEVIDHKKVVSRHELEDISNRITYLHRILFQVCAACDSKRNEFAYLHFGVQQLEGQLYGLKNSDSE